MNRLKAQLTYRHERRPLLLEIRSSKWFILSTCITATFTDIFLYGVIVPVIPFALNSRVGIPQDQVQYWVSVLLAVYGAALLGASPLLGWAADRISSRRIPLLFGLFLLAGATALLAVGTSIAVLIVGRILQGLSGAIVWISGLALLVDTVGQGNVGQMMGYVGASLSLALLLSPLLGGVVFQSGGYESVFAMCWGLIALDVILRLLVIEKKIAVKWLSDTMAEAAAQDVNVGAAEKSKSGDLAGQSSTLQATTTTATGVARTDVDKRIGDVDKDETAIKPQMETARSASPTPPTAPIEGPISADPPSPTATKPRLALLTLLTSPRLLASIYAAFIQASVLTALDSTLPLRVEHIFGWTSLGAGLVFLPISIPAFFSPVVGYITDRKGPRIAATLCFVLAAPFLILLRLITYNSLAQKVGLCAILAGIGFALALALPPIMTEMSAVVVAMEHETPDIFGARGAYAQSYSLFNMAFAAGCLVGPIWGGMVNERAGWGTLGWSLGLLSFSTAAPVFLLVGGPVWKRSEIARGRDGAETTVDAEASRQDDVDNTA